MITTNDGNTGPQRRRVLLVEDDRDLLQLLTQWLTAAGYDVAPFDRFEPARHYLKTETPDIIVTDVRLGAFNGLHLVVLAKMEHPDIMTLVLTAFEDPVLRTEAANLGATYLLKPCSADHLLLALSARLPS